MECLVAILACSLIHGTHLACQTKFLKVYLPEWTSTSFLWILENYCLSTMRSSGETCAASKWMRERSELCNPYIHRDLQGNIQPAWNPSSHAEGPYPHGLLKWSCLFWFYRSVQYVTICKIFWPYGLKLCYLRKNHPRIVFWKVCTRCESESLCSSKQYWQCMKKKSFKIDGDQIIRSWRPW